MSDYVQKVLWGEGVVLTPQHFQQADRYCEDLINRRVRAAHPLDWGLTQLRIDRDALAGGELVLQEGAAVLPDGTHVAFPGRDAAPPARRIDEAFPAGAATLGVYLAVPRARPGEAAVRDDPTSERLTPFDRATVSLRDEGGVAQEREVAVARRRIELLFTSESRDAYSCLPVAVLRRNAGGGFELEENFIPTCQYVAAAPRLVATLRRVLELLIKRSDDVSKQRRHRGDGSGMVDTSAAESLAFWFLYAVNSALPLIRSVYQQPRVHPYVAYRELAALAGALCTFSLEATPADIPAYAPDDLTGTFLPLEALLLKLLGQALPSRCVAIPVERTRDHLHVARVHDERLLSGGAQLYLAVAAEVPPERLAAELPQKAKISSADNVEALIVRALPGLPLGYLEAPPPEVPTQAGRAYFQLAQSGEHWEAIRTSGRIGFFVPAEFGGAKLELVAVKDRA